MKSIGGNSGYIGYSMSKRAMKARNEGAYPKSDFKREYSVTSSHFEYLESAGIVYVSEWHHTSKFGNCTDFYRWDEDNYMSMYLDNKKTISTLIKSVGKEPRMKDYAMEDMNQFCQDHNDYISRKKMALEKLKNIFYEG